MLYNINSRDSSVGRATRSHPQGCGFKPHWGQNYFSIIEKFSKKISLMYLGITIFYCTKRRRKFFQGKIFLLINFFQTSKEIFSKGRTTLNSDYPNHKLLLISMMIPICYQFYKLLLLFL